ncbi:MAG: site-specific integrase [Pedobacter sp.]|uniref:site-specific integrase n=1 Tax=Pedobacter sp. TaxID=1411316 RepID=UPI00356614A1
MSVLLKKGPVRKDGLQALFLLTYHKAYHESKPLRESLNTYVYAIVKTKQQKEHNRERLLFAEKLRVQREAQFDSGGHLGTDAFKSQGSFILYFKKLMKEKRNVEGSYTTWKATYKHLMCFLNDGDIKFKDCNDIFLQEFKEYLLKCKSIKSSNAELSNNTANIYLTKVKAALNRAVKGRFMTDNPSNRVENIRMDETFREYLTTNELIVLMRSKCKLPLLKKAFIFNCFTGLRWSDMHNLKWGDITYFEQEKTWKIIYIQKKTNLLHHLPITEQAVRLLGKFGDNEERIFKGLEYSAYHNQVLRDWVKQEGINKHITFHCARHTFAIIMLIKTKDIFVVSKLLGHKSLKTTMIYAKIVNATLNDAVVLFPDIS